MATAVKPKNVLRRCRRHRTGIGRRDRRLDDPRLLAGLAAAQTRAEPPKPANDPPAATPAQPPAPPAAESPGIGRRFRQLDAAGRDLHEHRDRCHVRRCQGRGGRRVDGRQGRRRRRQRGGRRCRGTAPASPSCPSPGVAGGHEQCTLAGNGAPDCRVAAEALCRARGFSTGTSVDFVTSEKCQPPYRSSSRDRRRASARWNIS